MAEITLKSAKKLFKSLGETIIDLEQDTDKIMTLLNKCDNIGDVDTINTIKGLLETKVTLNFVHLDICAAYRHYLASETHYEERHSIKNLNTIMSEGYKQLYGFTQKQNTFWKKEVKLAVNNYPEFNDEYAIVTALLIQLQENQAFDKDARDLAVHYDEEPRKVYKMLTELSAEEATRRFTMISIVYTRILSFLQKLNEKAISSLSTHIADNR